MSRTRCRPGKPSKGALRKQQGRQQQQGRAGPGVAGGGVAKANRGGARALTNATAGPHDADCWIRVGVTRLPVHSHVLSLHSGVLADALQRQSQAGQAAGSSSGGGNAEGRGSSSSGVGDRADAHLAAAFQGYSLTEVQAFLHLVYHPGPKRTHSRQAGGGGGSSCRTSGWAEAPAQQPQFQFHRLKQRQLERVVQLAAQLGADAVPARLEARLLDAGGWVGGPYCMASACRLWLLLPAPSPARYGAQTRSSREHEKL
jgi:hypothetical protein